MKLNLLHRRAQIVIVDDCLCGHFLAQVAGDISKRRFAGIILRRKKNRNRGERNCRNDEKQP